MKSLLLWLFLIAATGALVCPPVQADWYKYRDADGAVRYTDNLADVPVDQRKTIKPHEDAGVNSAPEAQVRPAENGASATEGKETVATSAGPSNDALGAEGRGVENYTGLEAKRGELDGMYRALSAELEKLNQERAAIKTAEEYRAYRAHVADYNVRAKEYQTRREAYDNAVAEFNARMKKKKQ